MIFLPEFAVLPDPVMRVDLTLDPKFTDNWTIDSVFTTWCASRELTIIFDSKSQIRDTQLYSSCYVTCKKAPRLGPAAAGYTTSGKLLSVLESNKVFPPSSMANPSVMMQWLQGEIDKRWSKIAKQQ